MRSNVQGVWGWGGPCTMSLVQGMAMAGAGAEVEGRGPYTVRSNASWAMVTRDLHPWRK